MTRTTKLKIGYFMVLVLLVIAALAVSAVFRSSLAALVLIAAVLLLPGRIQAIVYRDLYTARRLMAAGKAEESIECTRRFLGMIRRNPGNKKLLWASWSVYTVDVEAMALNNLGAAHLERGEVEAAEKAFEEALRLDPEYAIPSFNLAVIAGARGDRAAAERHVARAVKHGYRIVKVERAIQLGEALRERAQGTQPVVSG